MAPSVVREARRRAGISQRELARRAGTSQPAVARIEAGRQSPGHATLARLVEACGLELRYELAAPDQAATAPTVDGQLLLVEAGSGRFGLPVAAVGSVVRWRPPSQLPRAPAGVLGLVAIGGRLVTVLDPIAGMGVGAVTEPTALILLTDSEGAYALAVDRLVGLESPAQGALQPPPAMLGSPPAVVAMVLLGDELVTVLDPARLIPGSPVLKG